jgi:Dolichyl-phosphate-mannose-protein mannosyltransferase
MGTKACLSTTPSSIPRRIAVRRVWRWGVAFSIIVAAGSIVRLIGARGDLWLDEIWTLMLVAPVHSVGEILFDIGHDNNHHLNSIYLYLIGPGAPSLAQRGLSVAMGAATAAAAWAAVAPNGRAAAAFAMLLFAFAYPMVHYGSEARGYAGLVLFLLLAIVFLQRTLDRPDWRSRHAFGAAIGLGLLSHLTMVAGVAILGTWTIWALWRRSGSLRQAVVATLAVFRPALLWTLAIGSCVVIASLRHGFIFGGLTPFAPADFIDGYGGLIRLLLGVPDPIADMIPAWIWLVAAFAAITLEANTRRGHDSRLSLYVIAVIGWPATMFLLAVPNVQFGRYFLTSGTFLLLFIADGLGDAWSRGGLLRAGAGAALGAMLIGHAASLASFFRDQRGHYNDAITYMSRDGRFSYASDHEFRTRTVLEFFAVKRGIVADYIRREDWCRSPPQFMVVEDAGMAQRFAHLELGTPQCLLAFERGESFPSSRLSGRPWTIYHRTP